MTSYKGFNITIAYDAEAGSLSAELHAKFRVFGRDGRQVEENCKALIDDVEDLYSERDPVCFSVDDSSRIPLPSYNVLVQEGKTNSEQYPDVKYGRRQLRTVMTEHYCYSYLTERLAEKADLPERLLNLHSSCSKGYSEGQEYLSNIAETVERTLAPLVAVKQCTQSEVERCRAEYQTWLDWELPKNDRGNCVILPRELYPKAYTVWQACLHKSEMLLTSSISQATLDADIEQLFRDLKNNKWKIHRNTIDDVNRECGLKLLQLAKWGGLSLSEAEQRVKTEEQ